MAVEDAVPRGPAPPTVDLLERESELAAIDRLLARARDGVGALMLIEGAPGTGKSALLDAAIARARAADMTVARARGHELERSVPWGVVRALFERHVTASADTRPPPFTGLEAAAQIVFSSGHGAQEGGVEDPWFAIAHALYHLVVRLADPRAAVLIVDDAQWCDEPSLRFLLYLLHRLAEQPIALLIATRPGEHGETELLDALAADPLAAVAPLGPLSEGAVATLVRERRPDAGSAFTRHCYELTRGNPLELREILAAVAMRPTNDPDALRDAAEVAAGSLARSVMRRLDALPPATQALARAVAVLDDDADPGLAAAIAQLSIEVALVAVDELQAADLLRPGATLAFLHPLLRSAVYHGLRFSERTSMHQLAARLLLERGTPPEQVAVHLLESIPASDPSTVEVLRAAARRALDQGAPSAAARYLERALREPPAGEEQTRLLLELGRAEAVAGMANASAHLEAALVGAGDSSERAEILLDLARALAQARRLEDSSAAFLRGLQEIGEDGTDLALDLKAGFLTSTMHIPELASEVRRQAAGILSDDAALTTRAHRGLASKAMMIRLFAAEPYEETLDLARRIFAGGRLIEEDRFDSQVLAHVVSTLGRCDDYAAADEAIRLTLAAAVRSGSALAFAMASQVRARQALWVGPADDALADARAATDMYRGGGLMYRYAATYVLVWALLERNELDEGTAALAAIDAEGSGSGRSAWLDAARGMVAARCGDDAAALEAFLSSGRRLTGLLVENPVVLPWRSEAGLAAYRLGRHDQARELIGAELALAERFAAPRPLAVARRAAGLIDRERGIELLGAAADALDACGAELERARTLVDLGAAIRRSGQPRQARDVLRDALRLAAANGSLAVADRARTELRLAGGRAPDDAGPDGDRLTASERRVAELAAAGNTNRQIADQLFVTVKAVEWHLGNVYRKLVIAGRRELANALAKQPPN
jgi:DNA-binding CsgD family transcriptional regulator